MKEGDGRIMYKCISYSVLVFIHLFLNHVMNRLPPSQANAARYLYPPTLLHYAINVQYLSNRPFSTHEIPNIQTLIITLQNLQCYVVRSSKG